LSTEPSYPTYVLGDCSYMSVSHYDFAFPYTPKNADEEKILIDAGATVQKSTPRKGGVE
jgi:hypothetical protein